MAYAPNYGRGGVKRHNPYGDDGYGEEDPSQPVRRSRRKKRKKQKFYEGDVDHVYNDGDIVWAHLEDFPWWFVSKVWLKRKTHHTTVTLMRFCVFFWSKACKS